jgi:hypothetical protein
MIYVQDSDYNWYCIPEDISEKFNRAVASAVKSGKFDSFEKSFGKYQIEDQPYDHQRGVKTEERLEMEFEMDSDQIQPGVTGNGLFSFRFGVADIMIPVENAKPDLLLYLSMIEIHGWKYYEKMKVNYNLPLPPELEAIVSVECMRNEI